MSLAIVAQDHGKKLLLFSIKKFGLQYILKLGTLSYYVSETIATEINKSCWLFYKSYCF